MQTFLPFPDFEKSLDFLDKARLNKQVLETYQLAHGQWPNHPAAKMWLGFHNELVEYGRVSCIVARKKGIRVNEKLESYFYSSSELTMPWWFGEPAFHDSHFKNLKWKWNPVGEQPPYVWPVHRWEWQEIPYGVQINRRKKPILGLKKKLVQARTTTNKPCIFLLQGIK